MAAPITPRFILGNALALPLPDASVDLVVTSPPYFGLRDYNAGEHEVGSEATPAEFLDALVAATREMVRVLRPSGSIWVNLGDKYSQRTQTRRSSHQPGMHEGKFEEFEETWAQRAAAGAVRMPHQNVPAPGVTHIPEKSLMGLPWRYAIRCVDELGLVLREEVIWAKPNGLPESVKDRCARKHEQWFHFTVSPRYFAAMDPIREPHQGRDPGGGGKTAAARDVAPGGKDTNLGNASPNPLGKLPGSVWTVATEPLPAKAIREAGHTAHFAAFPSEWPRRIVLGWAPTHGICTVCGEGLRPVAGSWCACNEPIASPTGSRTAEDPSKRTGRAGFNRPRGEGEGVRVVTRWEQRHEAEQLRTSQHRAAMEAEAGPAFGHYIRTDRSGARPIPEALRTQWQERGWLTPAPPFVQPATRRAVVLDPFSGTGTTAIVASALGCQGIGVELNPEYIRLAQWRHEDGRLARKVRERTAQGHSPQSRIP